MIILTHKTGRTCEEHNNSIFYWSKQQTVFMAPFCSVVFLSWPGDIISESATRAGIKKQRGLSIISCTYCMP